MAIGENAEHGEHNADMDHGRVLPTPNRRSGTPIAPLRDLRRVSQTAPSTEHADTDRELDRLRENFRKETGRGGASLQGTPAGYRLWAVMCLGGRRPAPERTGIGSISMKLHHPVEEFAHGRRLLVEA